MIEVKEKILPFVSPVEEPKPEATTPETTELVEVITVIPPTVPRSTTSSEEDEEGERDNNFEIRQAATELDGYKDYLREQRGGQDGLNYGDW